MSEPSLVSCPDVPKNNSDDAAEASLADSSISQTRFSFYNADDFIQKSPPRGDSTDILRSLQEHEQQRLEILSPPAVERTIPSLDVTNPYEDAIKEALDLLRRHRTVETAVDVANPPLDRVRTPPESDRVLRSRDASLSPDSSALGEAYQAEIEARRKQRQERMAKYAERLAELKESDAGSQSGATPLKVDTSYDDDDEAAAMPDMNGGLLQTGSVSTITANKDDEVQRGVEKVLLAILERANSRGRGERSAEFSLGEEKKTANYDDSKADADENNLLQAMTDLLRAGGSSGTMSADTDEQPARQPTASRPALLSSTMSMDSYDPVTASRSAEDEVPAGDYEQVAAAMMRPLSLSHRSHSMALSEPIPRRDAGSFATELADTNGGVEAVASDPGPPGAAVDELDQLVQQFSTKSQLSNGSAAPVVQQLKHGNTKDDSIDERVRRLLDGVSVPQTYTEGTGDYEEDDSIVGTSLEGDTMSSATSRSSSRSSHSSSRSNSTSEEETETSYDEDDESHDPRNSTIDGVLGPLSKGTTGVVLEPDAPTSEQPTILESLSAAMSLVTGNVSGLKDKYSADHEDVLSDSDHLSKVDELMKTLCAHLLPIGVVRSNKLLERLPQWDESNPEEPGYRVVRLTNLQLRQVEKEFEQMVEKLKKNSHDQLRTLSGSDEGFQRDLQAAEDLLDQEEKRQSVTLIGSTSPSFLATATADDQSVASATDDESCLANFPGIKKTGRGEMGDLEYFHLPIIFKSHVTGFEPTKDLFLESGNVVAGQYLVEGELGSAAFSTAYRCIDLNSEGSGPDGHEEVCLKVIKNTKDFFDQSLDEIKILELLRQTGKCQEKAIVEMKTFFYHREHLIIVTELLRQNLFEFGKFIVDNDEEPYFTLPRLSFITRQVLVALDFVHSLGLVHSDVKPENILLGSYSRALVKLIDFGSSCYLTDRQSSYIQSRSYRAPEVVLGLPYDGRIDIWSLGCVVAEMFTGDVTFQNDSIVSMLSRIESICGPFPRHMIAQGRQSGRFFTKCGLLFERTLQEDDTADDTDHSATSGEDPVETFDIFQPKRTTLATRLGFEADLMELSDAGKKLSKEQKQRAMFVDFVRKLLTIDPEVRPTAKQALEHPWIQLATTLTEADIKYPSS